MTNFNPEEARFGHNNNTTSTSSSVNALGDSQQELQETRDKMDKVLREQVQSNELQQKLDEATKMCEELQASEAASKTQAEKTDTDLDAKIKEVEDLKQSLQEQQTLSYKKRSEIEVELNKTTDLLGSLQVQIKQSGGENKQLRKQLIALQNELDQKHKDHKQASESATGLNQQLQSVQEHPVLQEAQPQSNPNTHPPSTVTPLVVNNNIYNINGERMSIKEMRRIRDIYRKQMKNEHN